MSTALVGPHARPPSAAALRLPLVGPPGCTVAVLLAFLTPVAALAACAATASPHPEWDSSPHDEADLLAEIGFKAFPGHTALGSATKCLPLDLAGLEARGADIETLRGHTANTDQSLDALDVRVPAAAGAAVGVRDVVTEARSLAADVAVGSHGFS